MTAPLPSYRIKIERAKRHIRELAEEIEAFKARNPYSVIIQDDANAGQRIWKLKINECVPAGWSVIVGDAIHNARTALDHLMVAIVRRCDPGRQSYNHVHFVIRETRNEFEASLPKNIKGATAEAKRLIQNLKPYKGGDEAFWRLHQLDILDKHKAIIPVGSAHAAVGITMNTSRKLAEMLAVERPDLGNVPIAPMPVLFLHPADRQFPLKDGADLFRAPLDQELPFENNVEFRFDVAFGEGQIVDGEPVVPALTQLCQFVGGTFDIFERHILK